MINTQDFARAMCCRASPCKREPCQCNTYQLIPIHIAAEIAHGLYRADQATLCERWRAFNRETMGTQSHDR